MYLSLIAILRMCEIKVIDVVAVGVPIDSKCCTTDA